MYKAILVDDEPYVLEGLSLMVDFNKFDFEIMGKAKNGYEAIKLCEKCKPDLIVTDLRMPGINGVELIKKTYEINEDMKYIILTGHGEFSDAKESMKYNVRHFLLKPIDIGEMEGALEEIREELNDLNNKLNAGSLYRNIVVSKILDGCDMENEVLECGLSTGIKSWVYIITGGSTGFGGNGVYLKINDFLIEQENVYAPNILSKGVSFVMGIAEDMRKETEILLNRLSEKTGCSLKTVIGCECLDVTDIESSVNMVLYVNEFNIYTKTGDSKNIKSENYIFCDDIQGITGRMDMNADECIDKIVECIEFLDFNGARNAILEVYQGYEKGYEKLKHIQLIYPCLIFKITVLIKKYDGDPNWFFSMNKFDYGQEFNDIRLIMIDMCFFAVEYLKQLKKILSGSVFSKVENYLEEHFKENIVIKDLAKELYLSPVYLGSSFAKKYGMSIKEYIHRMRIEEALKIIRETNTTISDVAYKVGYNNYNNFYAYFERYVKMTPNEYKKIIKE